MRWETPSNLWSSTHYAAVQVSKGFEAARGTRTLLPENKLRNSQHILAPVLAPGWQQLSDTECCCSFLSSLLMHQGNGHQHKRQRTAPEDTDPAAAAAAQAQDRLLIYAEQTREKGVPVGWQDTPNMGRPLGRFIPMKVRTHAQGKHQLCCTFPAQTTRLHRCRWAAGTVTSSSRHKGLRRAWWSWTSKSATTWRCVGLRLAA